MTTFDDLVVESEAVTREFLRMRELLGVQEKALTNLLRAKLGKKVTFEQVQDALDKALGKAAVQLAR
jgi:hypothetical protein